MTGLSTITGKLPAAFLCVFVGLLILFFHRMTDAGYSIAWDVARWVRDTGMWALICRSVWRDRAA